MLTRSTVQRVCVLNNKLLFITVHLINSIPIH